MVSSMGKISRRAVLGGTAAAATAATAGYLGTASAAVTSLLDDRMATASAWGSFLSAQDLMWKRIPTNWFDGPFLGNGFLGALLYQPDGTGPLQVLLGHTAVQDHRPALGPLFGLCRLPVGRLSLRTNGTLKSVDLRLSLWNAELTGTVTTSKGTIGVSLFVHDQQPVLVATLTPDAGETGAAWSFSPDPAISPRADPRWKKKIPSGYTHNPAPTSSSSGSTKLVTQAMIAGGGTVTAWRQSGQTLYLSIAHSFPDTGARTAAVAAVGSAVGAGVDSLRSSHRKGWHAFYPKSFFSFPDARLQSFWWIQLYKMNSVTRGHAPILATMGPWVTTTPWPAVWYDGNVQTEYWLLQTANHQEIDSCTNTFAVPANQQNLVNQVPSKYRADSAAIWRETDMFLASGGVVPVPGTTPAPPWETTAGMEIGDLPFALSNVWLAYRHTMDDAMAKATLFPLLRKAVNYYLHFLTTGSDGKLHLPSTYLPESVYVADNPYDLTLLRWACRTLLELNTRLKLNDSKASQWRNVLDTLTGDGRTTEGAYPLYLVTVDQGGSAKAYVESLVDGWQSEVDNWNGFHTAHIASVAAVAGRGEDAFGIVRNLLDRLVKPSTMYAEATVAPVIESPLAGANSVNDMLLQSWDGIIRIFPAVPAAWKDVTVHNGRCQGSFLVSARRTGGVTRFVRVLSLAGEPCLVRTGFTGTLTAKTNTGRVPKVTQVDARTVQVDLRTGEEVVLYPAGTSPALTIAPVDAGPVFRWGLL
jgi:alpha-L-fucosidase 2